MIELSKIVVLLSSVRSTFLFLRVIFTDAIVVVQLLVYDPKCCGFPSRIGTLIYGPFDQLDDPSQRSSV